MLRRGVIQRKTIGMFFHEGGSEFAQGGVRICAGGVLHLQKGGSEFGQGVCVRISSIFFVINLDLVSQNPCACLRSR